MNSSFLFPVFLLIFLLFSPFSASAEEIQVVESETGFYYTIQKGDTLWDLSNHFNNSPWLWPELWQENDQISNPHWIFPGERIRLYKKSGTQTLTKMEPSQPVSVVPTTPPSEKTDKKSGGPFFVYPSIDRIGFIRKPPVPPLGTIFEVQGRKTMISEGDTVYIRPAADAPAELLIPGSRHTIYRYMEPTEERDSLETIGTQHYILGIVEVTQKEQDLVLAKVVKSFRPIEVDDLVMPYGQRSPKIELKPSPPGIDGHIIISEDHTTLTGDHMLAFIDKGRADRIEVGQQYRIYRQQKTDLKNNQISTKQLPPDDFGTLLVLHTEQTTSTVVITFSEANISAGEKFRTPVN